MLSRPAVSRIKTSWACSLATCRARFAICAGVSESASGNTPTSACSPNKRSCSRAAGRVISSDATITFLRSRVFSRNASLPAVVVLPDPCKPTIKITAGGLVAIFNGAASPPSISTSASCTILMTCWSGRTDRKLATPTASVRSFSIKLLTTGKATSASSKARRTSRNAASTSASDSAPRLASPSKTVCNLPFNVSNMKPVPDCLPS